MILFQLVFCTCKLSSLILLQKCTYVSALTYEFLVINTKRDNACTDLCLVQNNCLCFQQAFHGASADNY